MNLLKIAAFAAILLSLFFFWGCSSNEGREPQLDLLFITEITSQGKKAFQLSFTIKRERSDRESIKRGRKNRPEGGHSGSHSAKHGVQGLSREQNEDRKQAVFEKMEAQLVEQINTTGYCRQGYVINEKSLDLPPVFWLRGECVELASDEDRALFTNKQTQGKPKVTFESLD